MRPLIRAILFAALCGRGLAVGATLQLSPSSTAVSPGETITINADIVGIGSPGAMEVGAFDIFIGFDAALVAPTGVTFGLLLGDPSAFEALTASSVTPDMVEAAEVSFLPTSSLDSLQTTSSFTLATFSFEGRGSGTATFEYDGGPVDDGHGNLIAGTKTVVPEPNSLVPLLIAMACCALWALGRDPRKTGTSRPREFPTLLRGTNVPFALRRNPRKTGTLRPREFPTLLRGTNVPFALRRNPRKTGTSRLREFLTLLRGTNVPFALGRRHTPCLPFILR